MVKITWLAAIALLLSSFTVWHHNLEEAKQLAKKEHKYILLNFSGSDWCGPCIRLHHDVFASTAFQQFADTALIMLNANFPRLKKNQLSAEQQKINESLADKYNAKGIFPLTVLLNENGKVVKQWEGCPDSQINVFINNISAAIQTDKGQ